MAKEKFEKELRKYLEISRKRAPPLRRKRGKLECFITCIASLGIGLMLGLCCGATRSILNYLKTYAGYDVASASCGLFALGGLTVIIVVLAGQIAIIPFVIELYETIRLKVKRGEKVKRK